MWWISIINLNKPVGNRFYGVIITNGDQNDIDTAIQRCRELGLLPKDDYLEILGDYITPTPQIIVEEFSNRVLSYHEANMAREHTDVDEVEILNTQRKNIVG